MRTIRVRDPIDLVKVLPYQLGFHPSESLVLIGMRGPRLGLIQRLDLPTEPDAAGAAADRMAENLAADRCGAAVVIRYETRPGQSALAGAQLATRLRSDGVEVREHLLVRDGRVYFPECGTGCHPVAGVALPHDHDVPAVADFVALGANPLASRERLAERVAAADGPIAARIKAAADRLDPFAPSTAQRARAMADWARLLDVTKPGFAGAPTSAVAAARMAVSLLDIQLRDLLTAWLCPGTLGPSAFDPKLVALARSTLPGCAAEAEAIGDVGVTVERLCWLARQCPRQLAPGVLTVLASYAWFHGDGALASVALDRALAIDPAYRLALLVEQLVALAIHPQRTA
ncbi:MAG: DUF4192 domain-containing protein [Dermatophilaceae bacterium]